MGYLLWVNAHHFRGDITKQRGLLQQEAIEGLEIRCDQPLVTEGQQDKQTHDTEEHVADACPRVHTVNLEAQIEQKEKGIKKVKADSAVQQQNAGQFQSMVALTPLIAENVQKMVAECDYSVCQGRFDDTIKANEKNIRQFDRTQIGELRKCKKPYSDCQEQADKLAKQLSKNQALLNFIIETETKLRTTEETNSILQRRYQELTQKTISLVSQLHATKSQLDESNAKYHDQIWPLHTENAKMKAEITSLQTTRDEKKGKISDLKRLREEHSLEKDELEDRIEILEKQRVEAVARAESWRLKWQDLNAGKDRAVMYSDPSGDITMIDPPGAAMKVDIPWVLEAGQENIKLRLEIENLTSRLEEAKEAAINAGRKANDQAIDFRLKFEAAEKELKIVKKDLDVAVKDYLGVLQDIEMDPTNLYHPIYKKMEGLRLYIKESEEQNTLLKAMLEDEKTRAWDRRTSMVECLS